MHYELSWLADGAGYEHFMPQRSSDSLFCTVSTTDKHFLRLMPLTNPCEKDRCKRGRNADVLGVHVWTRLIPPEQLLHSPSVQGIGNMVSTSDVHM